MNWKLLWRRPSLTFYHFSKTAYVFDSPSNYPQCILFLLFQPKRPSDREIVRKANKEPLCLVGIDQKVTLGEDFIDETLLISDILEMNEILSVELLLSGER